MTFEAKIKKVLVVLSPDLIRPENPLESTLLKRAVELARISGCELELFHVSYDGDLEHQLFTSDDQLAMQRKALTDKDATVLAEIATRLQKECVDVRYEVRWDRPRTDAILRKIAQSRPDVVMKQSREHSFIMGISSNTDWDLARRSPANLWFVNEGQAEINRIVVAVGNKSADAVDITTATDYEIVRTAGIIADTFKAEIYPVNAYQLPNVQTFVAGAFGDAVPIKPAADEQDTDDRLVKRHTETVKAIAQYFHIAGDNVHVREGRPDNVVPEVADEVDADMIVMGAESISRVERIVSSVTVEPVMADAECDIFVVRERDRASMPAAARDVSYGESKYDLEHAITNPEATFESPQEVANMNEISFEFRRRILQAWEYDIRAEMAEENEGGAVKDIDVDALDRIQSAKALLAMNREKAGNGRSQLSSAS